MDYKEHRFSLEHFKKWMRNQDPSDEPSGITRRPKPFVGVAVESKIDTERLLAKMDANEGVAEDLAERFMEDGGTIIDVDDKTFLIEVDGGSFNIHRCYVRKA